MDIASFGIRLDPSGVVEGVNELKTALDDAKARARDAAKVIGEQQIKPALDTSKLDEARGKYAEAIAREKELTKAIQVRNQEAGSAARGDTDFLASQGGGLRQFEDNIKRVQDELKEAQQYAGNLLNTKPVGANPALDEEIVKIRNLKTELRVLQEAYAAANVSSAQMKSAKPENRFEASEILSGIRQVTGEIAKVSSEIDKVQNKHLLGEEAVAKPMQSLRKLEDTLENLIARTLELDQTGLKNFDTEMVSRKLVNLRAELSALQDEANRIKGATAPTLSTAFGATSAMPQAEKAVALQEALQAANQRAKDLQTSLAMVAAAGNRLSPEQMAEYSRQLKTANDQAKVLQQGLAHLEPSPAAKSEVKDLSQALQKLSADINKVGTDIDKVKDKHLFGEEAVSKATQSMTKIDQALAEVVSRIGKLDQSTGFEGFDSDVSKATQKVLELRTQLIRLKDDANNIKNASAPNLGAAMSGAQPSTQNVRLMQAELDKANQTTKNLVASLGILEAQGRRLSAGEMVEFKRQLAESEDKAKRLTQGMAALGHQTKQSGHTAMQLYGFFMGIQSIFAAPLAKAAGLSDKTQEVIDKITGMGMAGFSAGQLVNTSFGIAAAGVMAVAGAAVGVISQVREAQKETRKLRDDWLNLRRDAVFKGDQITVEPAVAKLRELQVKLDEVQKAWFNDDWALISGNLEVAVDNMTTQFAVLRDATKISFANMAEAYVSASQKVKDEKASKPEGKSYKELKEISDDLEKQYYKDEKAARDAALALSDYSKRFKEFKQIIQDSEFNLPKALKDSKKLVTDWSNDLLIAMGLQKKMTESSDAFVAAHEEMQQKGQSDASKKNPYDDLIKKLKEARDLQIGLNRITQENADLKAISTLSKGMEAINALRDESGELILKEGDARRGIVQGLINEADAQERLRKAKEDSRKQVASVKETNEDLEAQLLLLDYAGKELVEMTIGWGEYKKAVQAGTDGIKETDDAIKDLVSAQAMLKDALGFKQLTKEIQQQYKDQVLQVQVTAGIFNNRATELKYLQMIGDAEAKNLELTDGRKEALMKMASAQQSLVRMSATKSMLDEQADSLLNITQRANQLSRSLAGFPKEYEAWNRKQEISKQLLQQTGENMEATVNSFENYINVTMELEHQMSRAFYQFSVENSDLWGNLESAGVEAINSINSAWSEWITGGEFDVEQLAKSIHKNFTEVTVKFLEAQVIANRLQKGAFGDAQNAANKLFDTTKARSATQATFMDLAKKEKLPTEDPTELLEKVQKLTAGAQLKTAELTTAVTAASASAGAAAASASAAAASAALAASIAAEQSVTRIAAGAGSLGGAATTGIAAGIKHAGGYTNEPGPSRNVSSSVFYGAKSFGGGGDVRGDEIPIIAHDNEAVVPLANGRRIPVRLEGGGGGPQIHLEPHFHFGPGSSPEGFMQSRSQIEAMLLNMVRRALSGAR